MAFLGKRLFETRIVVKRCEYRFGNGVVDVVSNVIHQRKRSHTESANVCHRPIDGSEIGNTFFVNTQGFAIKRTCHTIHNKARSVFTNHRNFFPAVFSKRAYNPSPGPEKSEMVEAFKKKSRGKTWVFKKKGGVCFG